MIIKNLYKQKLFLFLIIFLASIIFLTNLGAQGYSFDEPETVTIAKSILKFGYPSAWDGTQVNSQGGLDFTIINGMYFWTWHPWMQFYLVAPFYLFFGNSATWLRVPFALFGVATVVIFYQLAMIIFIKIWLAFILSIQLIFLLPFFLYVRQIRYYSPSAFFSIILFIVLLRLFDDKFNKKMSFVLFIIG